MARWQLLRYSHSCHSIMLHRNPDGTYKSKLVNKRKPWLCTIVDNKKRQVVFNKEVVDIIVLTSELVPSGQMGIALSPNHKITVTTEFATLLELSRDFDDFIELGLSTMIRA